MWQLVTRLYHRRTQTPRRNLPEAPNNTNTCDSPTHVEHGMCCLIKRCVGVRGGLRCQNCPTCACNACCKTSTMSIFNRKTSWTKSNKYTNVLQKITQRPSHGSVDCSNCHMSRERNQLHAHMVCKHASVGYAYCVQTWRKSSNVPTCLLGSRSGA